MKRNVKNYGMIIFISALVLSQHIKADVVWKGSSISNVKNEDLVIDGDVKLPKGETKIEATKNDVHVFLEKDSIVRGSSSGKSRLYLTVAEGRKIVFCLDHKLTWRGSESNLDNTLLLLQSGHGEVVVEIKGGHSFNLDSKDKNSAGAFYYIFMEVTDELSSKPKLRFRRKPGESISDQDKNVEINIKRNSLLGFLASSITFLEGDKASLQFDPTNFFFRTGRMVLNIEDKGALVIAGVRASECDPTKIKLNDIDQTIAAGEEAIVSVVNSGLFGVDQNAEQSETKKLEKSELAQLNEDQLFNNNDEETKQSEVEQKNQTRQLPEEFTVAGLLVVNKNNTLSEYLADPFFNLGTREDKAEYKGKFNGVRYGWVLGANGRLVIENEAYVQYVGLTLNQTPKVKSIPGFEGIDLASVVKPRNASAFIVDGNNNPAASDARIFLGEKAALFFLSGVGRDGKIKGLNDSHPFTVDILNRTPGAGNFLLDVEGPLKVFGPGFDGAAVSKLEVLSLEVASKGGSVLPGIFGFNFPRRTFEKEFGELLQYNCGAFFVNNTVNLSQTSLAHTDQCHKVFRKNSFKSEPTYVGGESFLLKPEGEIRRPNISLLRSRLRVYTDLASTGMDWAVPNFVEDDVCLENLSEFVFYQNGPSVDDGTGRQMILGTRVGSTAADGCTLVNCDSHLDLQQLSDCGEVASIEKNLLEKVNEEQRLGGLDSNLSTKSYRSKLNRQILEAQVLVFLTEPSSPEIVENLGDTSKSSIHTVYLGCNSNISIGTDADMTNFDEETFPCLLIFGNYFSFESEGGPLRMPSTSNITGKGGMFVDRNGKVSIDRQFRASFGMMVTKSRNGFIDLPKEQIFFEPRIGIADWRLNLNDPSQHVIISGGECLSDYTLNWININKDYENFCPYEVSNVNLCSCPPVEEKNVQSLPTIQGTVNQLQIQGSRIGDQAQIVIDGGWVRELVFLNDNYSAQAPVAAVILRNDGRIGLNSAHRNTDSLLASDTLGVNGLTIIADGEGIVNLNNDMIIDNVCAILKGPNFNPETNTLTISSTVDRELRLKSTGVLDLSSFGADTNIIFGGDLFIVFEPGSRLVLGGGTLTFQEDVTVLFEPSPKVAEFFASIPLGAVDNDLDPLATVLAALPHNQYASLVDYGSGLHNTDQFRVKINGTGRLLFKDNAIARLPFDSFVGVETYREGDCEITETSITLELQDGSRFFIGKENFREGGVLQVGNVEDLSGHSVSFELVLDGDDAQFVVGSLGVVGLGAGVEKACATNINEVLVNTLYNVDAVRFNYKNGLLDHSRIWDTTDIRSSLLAIGDTVSSFDIRFEEQGNQEEIRRESEFSIHGGGNIVLVKEGTGAVTPFVENQDDQLQVGTDENGDPIFSERIRVGMLASTPLIDIVDRLALSPSEFFEAIKTLDSTVGFNSATNLANAATIGESFREARTAIRSGIVANGVIIRDNIFDILGDGDAANDRDRATDLGAMFASVLENAIILASNLPS
ncbi:MAG: hypothetical protein WCD44_03425 [Candidatus Babeliales bacterium]